MDVFDAYAWATGGWLALQAIPLITFPAVIIAILSPEIREASALEEYLSRGLGLNLLIVATLVVVLTGVIPLTSSISAGAPAGVESTTEDSRTPYASTVVTIATIYHTASAILCYVSHHSTGRWGLMMGALGSGTLAAFGLWYLLFAGSGGRISKKTGADKRTSGFPFQNSASASAQRKAQKCL